MPKLVNIKNQRFGRLTAIEFVPGGKHPKWRCKCDCGSEAFASSSALTKGNTKSCGCLHREATSNRSRTHGLSRGAPVYRTWCSMIARCEDVNCEDFPRYGGRGISICSEWRASFEIFLADMGLPPSRNHSIDRIDNNEGYRPGNCRWAIKRVQANNTRRNVRLTFQGKTRTLSEWSEILGLPYVGLAHRIRRGWSVDLALTKPFRDGKTKVSYRRPPT